MIGPGLSAVRSALNDLGAADLHTKACVGAVVGLPALMAVSWVNTELYVKPIPFGCIENELALGLFRVAMLAMLRRVLF